MRAYRLGYLPSGLGVEGLPRVAPPTVSQLRAVR